MHRPSFEIREATASDSLQIAALYRLLVPGSPVNVLPERLSQLHGSPDAHLAVAERNGLILGTAFLCLCPDPMYGVQPFGVVENVVVLESARGSGVGSSLLAHIERLALEADCSKIMLSSAANRTTAHAFFERSGFAPSKIGFVMYRRAFGRAPSRTP
jgi:N-acetylglutamate synthase-like GNAT family acetyltransferase